MTAQREGDRLVISGRHGGNQFPSRQLEIDLNVELRGTNATGPFELEGSLYGRNIRFVGPGLVRGCVLGRGDIELDNRVSGMQRLLAGLNTTGNVVAVASGQGLDRSPVASAREARYLIRGNVVGENVNLDGAVVFGSVEGTRVALSRCVVFGSVLAKERLTVRASTMLAYRAMDVAFEGPCMVLHALGESASMPTFVPFEDVKGMLIPASVQFYPIVRGLPGASFFNRTFLGVETANAMLSPEHDWVKKERADGSEMVVLSLMGRVHDFARVRTSIETLHDLLRTGLEFEHYSPQDQTRTRERWKSIATADERWVMEQTTGLAPFDREEA
jgi:hypothetical protein